MTLDAFLADPGSRFATVAMTDTNGLLRGQMVSASSLRGIAKAGMGMAPAQLALDPTDVHLTMPGVNDDAGDFHDDPLILDPASVRRMPWSKPGHDLLVLSNFTGQSAEIVPPVDPDQGAGAGVRGGPFPEIRDGAGIHPVRRNP